jgi:hypothetical protein
MTVDGLKLVARLGYGARGLVYLVVGGLAVVAALGAGGRSTGSRGALSFLETTTYGAVILAAIALGLVCYSLWRGLQSLFDTDLHGTGVKGLTVRGGLLVSAFTHLLLAAYAASLTLGVGGGGSGSSSQDVTAWLMQQPFGRWLVLAFGIAVIGAGVSQAYKGVTRNYRKYIVLGEGAMRSLDPICLLGLVARGAVFVLMGGFFAYAGLTIDPSQAGGVGAALNWLQGQPYGRFLFAALAVGLFAFGLYSLIEAIWRRIDMERATGRAPAAAAPAGGRLS